MVVNSVTDSVLPEGLFLSICGGLNPIAYHTALELELQFLQVNAAPLFV